MTGLPKHWDIVTIEQIARPVAGAIRIGPFGSALKKHEYADAGVRVLGIEDVFPNQLVSTRVKYIPKAKYQELTQYSVERGDLLVTNMGTVGRTCVVPDDLEASIISSHLIKVSLDERKAWPPYVSWALNFCPSVLSQIQLRCHGAIMAGFNSALLKQLRIPLPRVPEQRRIAEILDKADALRAKRRAALAQLDTLTQSIFLDLFGDPATNPKRWPVSLLRESVARIQIGPFGSLLHQDDYIDRGIPLVNPKHIRQGAIEPEAAETISARKFAELASYHLRAGDVVMGRRGEMGRCAVVNEDSGPLLCGTGSLFIRLVSRKCRGRNVLKARAHRFTRLPCSGDQARDGEAKDRCASPRLSGKLSD
jgi:type I restriction enzyme S subunit